MKFLLTAVVLAASTAGAVQDRKDEPAYEATVKIDDV